MKAKDIVAILEANMRSRSEKQPSVWRDESGKLCIRASSAGSCPRRLWYYAQGEKPLPDSIESIHATDAGNRAHDVLREMMPEDVLMDQETEVIFDTDEFTLIGHVDGKTCGDNHQPIPVEFKSAKQYGFDKVLKDGLDDQYKAQIHIYMAALGAKRTIIIFDNKPDKTIPAIVSYLGYSTDDSAGVLAGLDITFDEAFWRDLLIRLESVGKPDPPDRLPPETVLPLGKSLGKAGLIPVKPAVNVEIYPWQCAFCSFAHTCRPEAKLYRKWGKSPVLEGYQKGQRESIRLGEPV